MKVEEEDAEALLNEIDLEFEANFDSNLQLLGHLRRDSSQQQQPVHNFSRMQKVSSEDSVGKNLPQVSSAPGNNLLRNSSSNAFSKIPNIRRQQRVIDEYDDRVPCNCSVLEVFPIIDGNQAKETIFMGTYDGSLYAMRMVIRQEHGENLQYVLQQLKKWNLSSYIISMIAFNINNLSMNTEEGQTTRSNKSKQSKSITPLVSANSSQVFRSTLLIGGSGSQTINQTQKSKRTNSPFESKNAQLFYEFLLNHQLNEINQNFTESGQALNISK